MLRPIIAALAAAATLAAGSAVAQGAPAQRGKQVSIPLVGGGGGGGIRTFEPTRSGDGLYIRSFRGDWYLARFGARCLDLPHASAIAFKSFSSMSLTRGDTILSGREQCRISSIARTGPPPKKMRKQRRS